jgi:hypothetical protein
MTDTIKPLPGVVVSLSQGPMPYRHTLAIVLSRDISD